MTISEACDVAYSVIIEDFAEEDRLFRAQGHKFEMDLDERIGRWEEKFGLRYDPEAMALLLHKRWLAQRGMAWDDTPVEQDWRMRDEEIKGVYMGGRAGPKGEKAEAARIADR